MSQTVSIYVSLDSMARRPCSYSRPIGVPFSASKEWIFMP